MQLFSSKFLPTAFISLFALSSVTAYASDSELTLVNHFTHSINFSVGINPDVVPNFHGNFALPADGQIKTSVLDINKQAYIRGDASDESKSDFVYFGVIDVGSKTMIHGYLSSGIAYSWNNQTITFCTPDEYKKKKSC